MGYFYNIKHKTSPPTLFFKALLWLMIPLDVLNKKIPVLKSSLVKNFIEK